MLGFINAQTPRQKKNGFSFPKINRDFVSATYEVVSPARASRHMLNAYSTLNAASNGMAVTLRLSNTSWRHAGTETLFVIGDSNNYIYFQKRQSGYKLRWGLVSNGNIQLIDEFSVDYLYDGYMTIGASIGAGEVIFCINGVTISRQTTNIALPDITSIDRMEVGQAFDTGQQVNSSVAYDYVRIWDSALSKYEIENATFDAAPLPNISFDNNLWTVIKAGQSNSKADGTCVAPDGYALQNPLRTKMITKDLTVRPYADPYSTLEFGNVLNSFDDIGGFSAAGVTADRLASQYGGKMFAAMACNRGGSGLVHAEGSGKWSDQNGALVTTGDATRISVYTFAAYLSMLIARQYGHLFAIEWYQGETDGTDGANVTIAEYQNALISLFDQWRLVMPPIRIVIGLSDVPASGFSGWTDIQTAQATFDYPNTYHVSAQNLDVFASEDYHLSGQGQFDLGVLVADKLIEVNQ
jgi:hypothetical protein